MKKKVACIQPFDSGTRYHTEIINVDDYGNFIHDYVPEEKKFMKLCLFYDQLFTNGKNANA